MGNKVTKEQQTHCTVVDDEVAPEDIQTDDKDNRIGTMIRIINILRHKATGPEQMPTELFKDLEREQSKITLELLSDWWNTETVPQEVMSAKVALQQPSVLRTRC